MKFSELWLREWINPAIDSAALVEQITMSGLEVESIEPVAGCFSGILIGRIIKYYKHSNIDKLRVAKVDIGTKRLLNIVCNDFDCRVGLCVVVATIGALLPGGFEIKANRLHGELSEGILCSFSELGISDNYNGIIELPIDAPIGNDIRDYLQLDDNIIDISIASNRADCLSLLGIARDIAVFNNMSFIVPTIKPVIPIITDILSIHIDTPKDCPHYLGRIIKDINIDAVTPLWMKEKLRRCGLRSVNAIVDITNYVLLELGQPIHVLDLDRIDGDIFIRQANFNETLTIIDGKEITLTTDTLIIADKNKVLAIAGIFVNSISSISSSTCNIMLECAYFHPSVITECSRRYGLYSNTSNRYERGVDPALQIQAMERATALVIEICGGHPGPIIDVTTTFTLTEPTTIVLRRNTMTRIIGYTISDNEVEDILIRTGCQFSYDDMGWQVLTPSWRFDITIEEDLIEEIMRIYGYNTIPNISIQTNLAISSYNKTTLPLTRVKMLLVDRGYQEVITYSFVNPKVQEVLYPKLMPLILPCPISKDMSVMRLSLWTGLIDTMIYNQNRQQQQIRLFECGLRFIPDNTVDLGVRQDFMLAGIITGMRFGEHWDLPHQPVDFYDIKGDLEAILELTGKIDNVEFKMQYHSALHPRKSAAIYLQNELIGFIGVIHPEVENKLNLSTHILVFEILWDKIAEYKMPKIKDIPRFPANRRDIAIVVADNIPASDIIAECKKITKEQLVDINLFDIYRGIGVAEGFKSLAISLILQNDTCTLKEKEIAMTVAKCVAALKQRFQASLRD